MIMKVLRGETYINQFNIFIWNYDCERCILYSWDERGYRKWMYSIFKLFTRRFKWNRCNPIGYLYTHNTPTHVYDHLYEYNRSDNINGYSNIRCNTLRMLIYWTNCPFNISWIPDKWFDHVVTICLLWRTFLIYQIK